jgi:hypothetical protein
MFSRNLQMETCIGIGRKIISMEAQLGPIVANPLKSGWGWNNYSVVFASSEGVIYGITPSGELNWYRKNYNLDGGTTWVYHGWAQKIGTGWNNYTRVFAT